MVTPTHLHRFRRCLHAVRGRRKSPQPTPIELLNEVRVDLVCVGVSVLGALQGFARAEVRLESGKIFKCRPLRTAQCEAPAKNRVGSLRRERIALIGTGAPASCAGEWRSRVFVRIFVEGDVRRNSRRYSTPSPRRVAKCGQISSRATIFVQFRRAKSWKTIFFSSHFHLPIDDNSSSSHILSIYAFSCKFRRKQQLKILLIDQHRWKMRQGLSSVDANIAEIN